MSEDYLSPYEVEFMARDLKQIDIKEFGSSE